VNSAVAALDKAAVEKLAAGTRDKDTLLVLYAPWCPFCQVWNQDGSKPGCIYVALHHQMLCDVVGHNVSKQNMPAILLMEELGQCLVVSAGLHLTTLSLKSYGGW